MFISFTRHHACPGIAPKAGNLKSVKEDTGLQRESNGRMPEYVLEPIREGAEFTLYRGRERAHQSPRALLGAAQRFT